MSIRLKHVLITAAFTFLCMVFGAFSSFASETPDVSGPADEALAVQQGEETSAGPGHESELPAEGSAEETYLGTFETTAYCSCTNCSPGNSLTYAGTVPQANHTISADLNVFPLGTKLKIGDTIYTVEDKGSGVSGNKLDIYFDTHAQALNYGRQYVDVYRVD